jgi:hypothetical protein
MSVMKAGSILAAALLAGAAPASAGLMGDSVVIKRVQGGSFVYQTANTKVGAGFEYRDNFFTIDITDNEVIFDAGSLFSIGDIVYTIEGLDFDDRPLTPNIVEAFSSMQIFGSPASPFDARRLTIGTDGKLSLSFGNTTGGGSGEARITLGAPVETPEPAALGLLAAGVLGVAARRHRR